MHFENPEILYALFLLIIPILVHLFQLRRFRRERFTNVKFLKKAILQTRRSSRVKKFLLLFLRILTLACVVIAFAQPYLPASPENLQRSETVIYLDNSYSMQAKGSNGILLRRSIQDILEGLKEDQELTLFTNNSEYINASPALLKMELEQLQYSSEQLDLKTVYARAGNYFDNREQVQKNLVIISDLQDHNGTSPEEIEEDHQLYLVKLTPENRENISIDSVFLAGRSLNGSILTVELSGSIETLKEVPVSLYNGDDLLAKRTISMDGAISIDFPLPPASIENGRVEIEDSGLDFDNHFYFSINEPGAIRVISIGEAEVAFLEKIYSKPDFSFNTYPINKIDYNELFLADLIILNQPEDLSPSLTSSLKELTQEDIPLVIIPSGNSQAELYNPLFRELGLPLFQEKILGEKYITDIAYDHPFFKEVFEEQVQNFQYPKAKSYFRSQSGGEKLLGLENTDFFLLKKENIFLFSSPLDTENTNFQKSPLIVPTFFNFGNIAQAPLQLFYILGKPHRIDVEGTLGNDEILEMVSRDNTFIPRQQSFSNKVVLSLEDQPDQPGTFQIVRDSVSLRSVSFNVNRKESLPQYLDTEAFEGARVLNNLPAVFGSIERATESNALWKWFIIFALFFLLTEMLILKYFK